MLKFFVNYLRGQIVLILIQSNFLFSQGCKFCCILFMYNPWKIIDCQIIYQCCIEKWFNSKPLSLGCNDSVRKVWSGRFCGENYVQEYCVQRKFCTGQFPAKKVLYRESSGQKHFVQPQFCMKKFLSFFFLSLIIM